MQEDVTAVTPLFNKERCPERCVLQSHQGKKWCGLQSLVVGAVRVRNRCRAELRMAMRTVSVVAVTMIIKLQHPRDENSYPGSSSVLMEAFHAARGF